MGHLLEKFDRSLYTPVYRHRPLSTEDAIKYVFLLNSEMEDLFIENYVKIPHAISSIFSDSERVRIDIERSFDEDDPYIEEELLLAPPEAQTDRFWRRKSTRLTYLVSQFFLALLTGELCATPDKLSSEKLINRHSPQEFQVMRQFFNTTMAENPEGRYQGFPEYTDSLLCLEHRLCLNMYHNMSSSMVTSRNLPNVKIVDDDTRKIALQADSTVSPAIPVKYEFLIWNHLFQEATSVVVELPAFVMLGRKVEKGHLDTARRGTARREPVITRPAVDKEFEKKEDENYYLLKIGGDQCLSRKHVQIYLPRDPSQSEPYFQDMGSTHGLVVFQDSSCQVVHSKVIFPGGKGPFPSPKDQYLKLGNTYVRIHPYQEKSQ